MAEQLVKAMTSDWKPSKYHDEYRDKLVQWISKKVKAGELAPAAAVPGEEEEGLPPAPINIMDLLKKSVEGKGGAGVGVRAASTAGRGAEGRAKGRKSATAKPKQVAHRKKAG